MKEYNAKKKQKKSTKAKVTELRKKATPGISNAKSLLHVVTEVEAKLERIAGLSRSLGFQMSLPGLEATPVVSKKDDE